MALTTVASWTSHRSCAATWPTSPTCAFTVTFSDELPAKTITFAAAFELADAAARACASASATALTLLMMMTLLMLTFLLMFTFLLMLMFFESLMFFTILMFLLMSTGLKMLMFLLITTGLKTFTDPPLQLGPWETLPPLDQAAACDKGATTRLALRTAETAIFRSGRAIAWFPCAAHDSRCHGSNVPQL